mgnify:FL=1
MAQETLRGSRLGSHSFESETNVVYSDRVSRSFRCASGHITDVVFALEAELPETWQCKTCSADAIEYNQDSPAPVEAIAQRPGRSHWQMLQERRTVAELEEILNEQLAILRDRRARGQVDF